MSARLSLEDRDAHMIRRAKSDSMCEADRRKQWAEMFRQSSERQQEFASEVSYVAFMEGCFRGAVSRYVNRQSNASRADSVTQKSDERALGVAKARGWCESDRREMWSSLWRQSSERQREFSKEDYYVAFMEVSFGRMKQDPA